MDDIYIMRTVYKRYCCRD